MTHSDTPASSPAAYMPDRLSQWHAATYASAAWMMRRLRKTCMVEGGTCMHIYFTNLIPGDLNAEQTCTAAVQRTIDSAAGTPHSFKMMRRVFEMALLSSPLPPAATKVALAAILSEGSGAPNGGRGGGESGSPDAPSALECCRLAAGCSSAGSCSPSGRRRLGTCWVCCRSRSGGAVRSAASAPQGA